ncbi:MAG: DEAD/DEAH box helicase [Nocardioidaceae bacterium]
MHVETTIPSVRSLDDATDVILDGHQPRPLQEEALALGPDDDGLWMVMYPTGEGKTEAALLRHGHRPEEHMIFALPTRATTNAMERRLNRILGATGNAVYLSHQFAGAIPTGVGSCGDDLARSEWFTSSIRRLVAPFVAATCDQVLAAALRQRQSPLRLLALANHHIVLDEVHTFDEYQTSLLRELLAWLGATRTRVTLLSATLPEKQATDLRNAYAAGAASTKKETLPYTVTYPGHTSSRRTGASTAQGRSCPVGFCTGTSRPFTSTWSATTT